MAKKSASRMKRKSNGKVKKAATKMAAPKKLPSISKPLTKGQLVTTMAGAIGSPRKQASELVDCLGRLIGEHVKPKGPGIFTLPGILKIKVVKKPARPAREGINPFTGEKMMFKATPARRVVKIRALKKLKEMVA